MIVFAIIGYPTDCVKTIDYSSMQLINTKLVNPYAAGANFASTK